MSLAGRRFEIPSRYRHLERVRLHYARWDLRSIDLVDPRSHTLLASLHPLDKTRNADGQRRRLDPVAEAVPEPTPADAVDIAPLLRKLLQEYAATGLPPAYLPKLSPDEEPPS